MRWWKNGNMDECLECGLQLCLEGNGCWLQLKGVCKDCHPTQHDSDYGEILWDKLERALASDKTKLGGSKGKFTPSKRLNDILFGTGNWFKEYAPDEMGRFFELLERQLSIEEEAGNLKGQSITLTHMINWVREHAKDDSEPEWALLERKLTVAEESEHLKSQSMTLQNMINWVREHVKDDPDREWVLLERKLTVEGEAENLKGQSITLTHMSNWARENARDDPDREWVLLEIQLSVEKEAENLKGQGMNLMLMINWVREHAADEPEREWKLLEGMLKADGAAENRMGQSMTLQHMINWVSEHAKDNPKREWVLLERKLAVEEEAENLKGQSMTLMLMINWVREHAKDDSDREWVLLERKLTVEDTQSQIITLTTMARFLLDKGLTDVDNTQVAFVVNKCLEYDDNTPIDILIAISMTLGLFCVDLPATTNRLMNTDDPLHRLIKHSFQDDKELFDSLELLFENRDEVASSKMYIVDALQGTHLLRTKGGIPTIDPKESLNGVVLDIPNIIGTWERELLDGTEESILLDDMIDVITERYDGEIWAHITPRTIIDNRPLVELLVANPRIKLYLSSTGQLPEDYSMIYIALARRLHIVTQDKFREEIETYPWLKDVVKEKRVFYKWLPSKKFMLAFSRKSPSQLALIPERKSHSNEAASNIEEKILTEEEIEEITQLQFKIDTLQPKANEHRVVREKLNSEVSTYRDKRNKVGELQKTVFAEIDTSRSERDRLNREAKNAKGNRQFANTAVREFDENKTENGPTLEELKELSNTAHENLVRIVDSAQKEHLKMTDNQARVKKLKRDHELAHRAFVDAKKKADEEHIKFITIVNEIKLIRSLINEIKG